jgi:peptidoglycan-associated lipoprotein
MRLKLLGIFAILTLLAACAGNPASDANNSNAGNSSSTSGDAQTGSQISEQNQPTVTNLSDAIAPGSAKDFLVNVGDRVFFDFDSSSLNAKAQETLQAQASWLQAYPAVRFAIEGHADERGTREYNLALSERRANAVKDYLIALGISENRMNTVPYGKERPAVEGSNEEAWAQNRRGVLAIN